MKIILAIVLMVCVFTGCGTVDPECQSTFVVQKKACYLQWFQGEVSTETMDYNEFQMFRIEPALHTYDARYVELPYGEKFNIYRTYEWTELFVCDK